MGKRFLLITLDSCRLDTAQEARTPFLDRLAKVVPSRAHASFTLPSHVAMFHGYFPVSTGDFSAPAVPLRIGEFARWGKVGVYRRGTTEDLNWLDGLRNAGFRTVGAAGMRWFKTPALRIGFDEFHYWGPIYSPSDADLPEWRDGDFALDHSAALAESVRESNKWMLFVNAAETHAPYGASGAELELQRAYSSFRNGKKKLPKNEAGSVFMKRLHELQLLALEVADAKIAALFAALPRPFDFLITADHGESFGEAGYWGHVVATPEVMSVPLWEGTYV